MIISQSHWCAPQKSISYVNDVWYRYLISNCKGEDVYQMCCLIFRLYLHCGLDEISLLAIWLAQKITRHEKVNILSNHLKIKGGRDGYIVLSSVQLLFIYVPLWAPSKAENKSFQRPLCKAFLASWCWHYFW